MVRTRSHASNWKLFQTFRGNVQCTYVHSSEIGGLCLMKCSSEMLHNLPYFWNTKTHTVFLSFFLSWYFSFSPNECPGLWRHEKNKVVAWNEKRKKLCGFSYAKSMANFEAFWWNISSFIKLLFLKSAYVFVCTEK